MTRTTHILPACAEVLLTELLQLVSQNETQNWRPAPKKPLCATSPGGLELHAKVTLASHDRKELERLCRYPSRPPIPQHGAGRGGAPVPVSRRQVRAVAQAHRRGARGAAPVVSRPSCSSHGSCAPAPRQGPTDSVCVSCILLHTWWPPASGRVSPPRSARWSSPSRSTRSECVTPIRSNA